jgi:hypothetical protein
MNFLNSNNNSHVQNIWEYIQQKEWEISSPEMMSITELTYSYDKDTWVNLSLFRNFWWIDIDDYQQLNNDEEKFELLQVVAENTTIELKDKINFIDNILDELSMYEIDNLIDSDIAVKKSFKNSIIEKKNFLLYALNAIPFEMEKALKIKILHDGERERLNQQALELDNEVYGWNVKDNSQMVGLALTKFLWDFDKWKDKLNKEEQIRIQKYSEKTDQYLPEWYNYTPVEESEVMNADFMNVEIDRETYIELFNMSFLAMGINMTAKIGKVDSISDTDDSLIFPETKNFDSMSIKLFLKRLIHEIEIHSVTSHNNFQLRESYLRGVKSTDKDEWLAMLAELIPLVWDIYCKKDEKVIIDTDKLKFNDYAMQTLMWEILDNDEFLDYLQLAHKIKPDLISPEARYSRMKRNNDEHVQHKDMAYMKYLLVVVENVNKHILTDWKEWTALIDYTISKSGFAEIPDMVELKKEKELEEINKINAWEKVDTMNIITPLFLGQAIYYLLDNKIITSDWKMKWIFDRKDFYNYLKKLIPIANISEQQVANISFRTKRQVYNIVNKLTGIIAKEKETAN